MPKANIYTYHWDWSNKQWNVFDPDDNFIDSYDDVVDARDYCDKQNEKLHASYKEQHAIQE
jgi:hypothetical protein